MLMIADSIGVIDVALARQRWRVWWRIYVRDLLQTRLPHLCHCRHDAIVDDERAVCRGLLEVRDELAADFIQQCTREVLNAETEQLESRLATAEGA